MYYYITITSPLVIILLINEFKKQRIRAGVYGIGPFVFTLNS